MGVSLALRGSMVTHSLTLSGLSQMGVDDSLAPSKQQHQNPVTSDSSKSLNGAALNKEGASPITHFVNSPPNPEDSEEQAGVLDEQKIGSNSQASNTVPLDTNKEEEIQQVTKVNDSLPTDIVDRGGEPSLVKITGYRWKESRLQLRYLLLTKETQ
eukprot:9367976-Ditylum_brightwellii.AAC.1